MSKNIGRKIAERLNANPEIQAIRARLEFEATDAVVMVVDLNDPRSDFRRLVVEDWCQAQAAGRWRRRVIERRGAAIRDQIVIEFEFVADADQLRHWLAARGW